jgi:hypothetical protein
MWLSLLLPSIVAASPGWGDPLDRCGGPALTVGERARREAACLVREAGPRGPTSPEGRARMWRAIDARLPPSWRREIVGSKHRALVACQPGRSPSTVLWLAHVDAVHDEVPGASDNASSIAILLEAARALPEPGPHTVCLAFPDGEEIGLRGSASLAVSLLRRGEAAVDGLLRADTLALAVSLDLVGEGALTWNGLGAAWDAPALRHLLRVAPADVPWVYRARSLALPELERSDHAPFALLGVRAAHLMSRGRSGVTWAYHTPADDAEVLDPETLGRAVHIIESLSADPPLEGPRVRGEPAFVLPWLRLVVPGFATWAWLAAAIGAAGASLADRALRAPSWRAWLGAALALVALPIAGGVAAAAVAVGRPLGGSLAEPAVAAAWIAAALVVAPAPRRPRAAIATVLTAALAIGLAALGWPTLAVPVATAAAAVGWAGRAPARWAWLAPLAAWPLAYLLRPSGLRELAFHGLVPDDPRTVAILLVALGPAALAWFPTDAIPPGRWRRVALAVAGVALAVAVVTGLAIGPWDPPFPPRDVRWPNAP